MKQIIIIFITIIMVSGCAQQTNSVLPIGEGEVGPKIGLPGNDRWIWNTSLWRVSEDHSTIEKLPIRTPELHLNVTPFLESPSCKSCLMIGKPQLQDDGTIKVKVMLTHPFPGQPQYTGFDVRGTIMFPATRYWMMHDSVVTKFHYLVYYPETPLYFSRAEDGGGQLLNADGYTFYLFPGLDLGPEFDYPIFKYSKGKYANGPDPDSTVNPYKLFTKDPDRRMFRVNEAISRTYHIDPPDGEFIFGYVVDASWAQPTTIPVTDPKKDFPFWANCEDGYVLGTEQIAPFKTGTYGGYPNLSYYDVVRMTLMTYPEVDSKVFNSSGPSVAVYCPDIVPDPLAKSADVAYGSWGYPPVEKLSPGVYRITAQISNGTYEAAPGNYLAIVVGRVLYYWIFEDTYPVQLLELMYFDFINLEVVN